MCNVVQSQLDNIAQSFYLCTVVPRVFRQTSTGLFPVLHCLEPIGHYCTRFLPVECCHKSINTTLDRISSCSMLSGVSSTTLHQFLPVQCCSTSTDATMNKIFACAMLFVASWITLDKVCTYAMLSQKYQDNIEQEFFLCIIVWGQLDNIAQSFQLYNVVQRVLRQH